MPDDPKSQVISALLTEGVSSDHPLSVWVYMLKKEGVPVISEANGNRLKHRIIDTSLRPNDILARRREGLSDALHWHRTENPSAWPSLLESIDCPFARDEAADYLRSLIRRQRVTDQMADKKKHG